MESQDPDHVFTSTDRIRQLNEIDKDVAELFYSAGVAIRALTNSAPHQAEESSAAGPEAGRGRGEGEEADVGGEGGALQARRREFKDACAKYFAMLSSVDVRLRRQVYALEEAGIVQPETSGEAPGATSATATTTATTTATAASGSGSGSGATNPLEISWLNSRKDTVGKDKEAELWEEARKLVSGHGDSQTAGGDESNATEGRGHMDVD